MESAPQSTITHNAVIEFASDPDSRPSPSPRERLAHKKKACPAQKGGLKSAGPCQNHIPGATPRSTKTVDFGRYLPRNRTGAAFDGRKTPLSENQLESDARTGCRRRRPVRSRHFVGRAARSEDLTDRK